MALSVYYRANYMLTKEKLRRKSESGAQNQLLLLKNRSQGKVNTQDFGALLSNLLYLCAIGIAIHTVLSDLLKTIIFVCFTLISVHSIIFTCFIDPSTDVLQFRFFIC